MKVLYGIDVESVQNEHIQNILEVLRVLSEATRPIAFLVDSMPIGQKISLFRIKTLTHLRCSEAPQTVLARRIG